MSVVADGACSRMARAAAWAHLLELHLAAVLFQEALRLALGAFNLEKSRATGEGGGKTMERRGHAGSCRVMPGQAT